ncbi:MAG: hydrogenase nickel incorporation protein HypB [Verrucomicrobiales bacterium]
MCGYCGCASSEETARPGHSHEHDHAHGHDGHGHFHGDEPSHEHHHHSHSHGEDEHRVIELSRAVLGKNARLAERARGLFLGKGLTVLNLVSSPGSGKTTLLEKTVGSLGKDVRSAVIVGDCATDNDARRIRDTGVPAVQVTTGNVCHLDAHMVLHAIEDLNLGDLDVLFIENVGNLVCPSAFDLGEDRRVVLTSVTEGEDKPKKYPPIFHDADAVVLTKMDLAEAVDLDRDLAIRNIREVAPGARIIELSAKTGEGMSEWTDYVQEALASKLAVAV